MSDAIEVLSAGMTAARLRVNVIAANLANAETTRTEDGGPYKRKDIVQTAVNVPSDFNTTLEQMTLAKPQVAGVIEDQKAPRMVFQPGHPDANPEGYVAYPNINVVQAMTDLMTATRLYQAQATAVESTRKMSSDASRLGGV